MATAAPRGPIIQSEQQDGSQVVIELQIPADLLYLQGHFPGTPIVPGVALTDWAIQAAARCFGREPRIAAIQRLKFHQVLRPNERVTLLLHHRAEADATEFRYRSAEHDHASGRLLWR